MKKSIIMFIIILGLIFVIVIAYYLIVSAQSKTDSYRKRLIESKLQLNLPESTEFESFVFYDNDAAISLVFKNHIVVRALIKINKSDEDYFKKQFLSPLWEIGNEKLDWQGSYWQEHNLEDAIDLYYRILPVSSNKSTGYAYVAIFPSYEDEKLIIGFNFFG